MTVEERAVRGRPIRPPASQETLKTGEVAAALGISNRTVLAWTQAGKLPSWLTPGGHRRFAYDDVWGVAADMGLPWATQDGDAR